MAKQPGDLRVIAIGDSFTFGAGVQVADGWVDRLERDLASKRAGKVEVINAGLIAGHNAATYAPWVEADARKLDPDAVVVGFCLNDVSLALPLWLPPHAVPAPLFGGASALATVAQQAWLQWTADSRRAAKPLRIKSFLKSPRDDWTATAAGLLSIQRSCAAMDARMVVVIFPLLSRLQEGYLLDEVRELVSGFCTEHAIEHVDLCDAFLGRDERELWVHPGDQHYNDVAMKIAADALIEWFAKRPLETR